MEVKEKINLSTVRSKWESTCKEIYYYFREDDENKDVIKLLLLYIARDERFENFGANFSINKGIVLHGKNGTGKTMLQKVFQRTLYYLKSDIHFKRYNMRELCQKYQADGPSALFPERAHCLVDEFGLTDRERANSYGNKITVGDEVIGIRYDLFQDGYLTHLTTNMTLSEMNDFYTLRTVSRLQEMMNFIPLDGNDRRPDSKPAPPVAQAPARVIDKKQIARDWWRMIIRDHAAYKESGKLDCPGWTQFKVFEEKGLINLSSARKEEYMTAAKRILAERRVKPTTLNEFRGINAVVEAIQNGTLDESTMNIIRSIACTQAIQDYYDSKTVEEFKQLIEAIINKI